MLGIFVYLVFCWSIWYRPLDKYQYIDQLLLHYFQILCYGIKLVCMFRISRNCSLSSIFFRMLYIGFKFWYTKHFSFKCCPFMLNTSSCFNYAKEWNWNRWCFNDWIMLEVTTCRKNMVRLVLTFFAFCNSLFQDPFERSNLSYHFQAICSTS